MDAQSLKSSLIEWLSGLEDQQVLRQLQTIKNWHEKELSESHKALLDDRIASYEKNSEQLLDWDEVMKEMEQSL